MKIKLSVLFLIVLGIVNAQQPKLVIPIGHTKAVTCAAFSKNGKFLLTGSRDFSAKLWDMKGHELITYKCEYQVQAVDISDDGNFVMTGSTDGYVTRWKITGEFINRFREKGQINSVAFSPDGSKVLSGCDDKTAVLRDSSGKLLFSLPHSKGITSVDFSMDGKNLITGSSDFSAIIWDANSGKKIGNPLKHKLKVTQVKSSKDYYLTCSADKSAVLWKKNGTLLKTTKHLSEVIAGDISHDKQMIATVSKDGMVKIWSATSKVETSFKTEQNLINTIRFAGDGKSVITTDEEGKIKQWHLNGHSIKQFSGHAQVIYSACFSNDGKAILTASADNTAKFWDAYHKHYKSLEGHKAEVSCVAISNDRSLLLTGSADKTVKLWDKRGKEISTMLHDSKVMQVGFVSDSHKIITCSYSGMINLWNSQGKPIHSFKQTQKIISASVSPDGNLIALSGEQKLIMQYDLSLNPLNSIPVSFFINTVSYSANSKSIIVGYSQGFIQVLNAKTSDVQLTLGNPGEGDEILSVSASSDGKWIASGDSKGKLKIWKTETSSRPYLSIDAHQTKVNSVLFSKNDKMLITASTDGTTKLWDSETGKEILKLVSLDAKDWVVTKPKGMFDASTHGKTIMNYVTGTDVLELEQIKEKYYEPGLLSIVLGIAKSEIKNMAGFEGVDLYPEIKAAFDGPMLNISLIKRSGGIGRLSISIDNKEIIEDANPERSTTVAPIDMRNFNKYFIGDSNVITIKAYESTNWLPSHGFDIVYSTASGSRATGDQGSEVNPQPRSLGKPKLYALCIGTSKYDKIKPLKLADFDAKSMAHAIDTAGSGKFETFVKTFTSDPTSSHLLSSKKNIKLAFDELETKVNANDIFIVYFSGHGETYGEGDKSQFYYLNKELPSEDLSIQANRDNFTISTGDLKQWLKKIAARKQVLIFDVCHSGKVAEAFTDQGPREISPTKTKIMDRFAGLSGLHIITGSAGDKLSYESSIFGQGLLTYSLLAGMSGRALTSKKEVDVTHLFRFAEDEVPALAESIGKVQRPIINSAPNSAGFIIGLVDKEGMIKVPSAKPVFIRSLFSQMVVAGDGLGLNDEFNKFFDKLSAKGAEESQIIFSDVSAYSGAYYLDGFYSTSGDQIIVTANLKKDKKLITTLPEIKGVASKIQDLCTDVYNEIVDKLE